MKIDRVAILMAVTVAVTSASMLLLRHSAWTLRCAAIAGLALLLALMYFDRKKNKRSRKWLTSLFLSCGYCVTCLGELLTKPGHFTGYGWGAMGILCLFSAYRQSKEKPTEPPLPKQPRQPDQISTNSFEPISKSRKQALRY